MDVTYKKKAFFAIRYLILIKSTTTFTDGGVRLFSKKLWDVIFIVNYKGYHCLFILTNKIVIASINSVSNLIVTGTNSL